MDARAEPTGRLDVLGEPLRDVTSTWNYPAHRLVATPWGLALVASRLPLFLGLGLLAAYVAAGILVPRDIWGSIIQYLDRGPFGAGAEFLVAIPLVISFAGPIAGYFIVKAMLTRVEFDQEEQEIRVIRPGERGSSPAADLAAVQVCFVVHGEPSYSYEAYQLILVFGHGAGRPERLCVESSGSEGPVRRMALAISEGMGVPLIDSATREHKHAERSRLAAEWGLGRGATLACMVIGGVFLIGAFFCFGAAAMQEYMAPGGSHGTPTYVFLAVGTVLLVALALDVAVWHKLSRRRRR